MMKISQNSILKITLSIILIIGGKTLGFSQTAEKSKLSEFLILIETTDNEIKLTSKKGCAWKELSFNLKPYNSQAVDQFGMTTKKREKPTNDENLADFLFTVKKTNEGLSLEGLDGTAWKDLSISCKKNNCQQYIDQNGMVEI
ncbi:hypothetical protein [Xanthovirga aplysinae]|uniref:hypothetical protein n=1 Tax=Xanthovirga aplysinae TaxID=2529853 RepID=UPI0012BB7A23|nr:hypothetical protein [Xanthovirga aplysinae]MTI30623.1 hypothetical protein [Xanthovirga aplysinae]